MAKLLIKEVAESKGLNLCWLFSVSVPKSLTHARNKRQKKALKGFISSEYTPSSARQTFAMK